MFDPLALGVRVGYAGFRARRVLKGCIGDLLVFELIIKG